jgi:hypothetical protein
VTLLVQRCNRLGGTPPVSHQATLQG